MVHKLTSGELSFLSAGWAIISGWGVSVGVLISLSPTETDAHTPWMWTSFIIGAFAWINMMRFGDMKIAIDKQKGQKK